MTESPQTRTELPSRCDECESDAVFATPDGVLCARHALKLIASNVEWLPRLRTPDGRQDRLEESEPVD
jgi:hypothetical protein